MLINGHYLRWNAVVFLPEIPTLEWLKNPYYSGRYAIHSPDLEVGLFLHFPVVRRPSCLIHLYRRCCLEDRSFTSEHGSDEVLAVGLFLHFLRELKNPREVWNARVLPI
jgi:hypothetical protein